MHKFIIVLLLLGLAACRPAVTYHIMPKHVFGPSNHNHNTPGVRLLVTPKPNLR